MSEGPRVTVGRTVPAAGATGGTEATGGFRSVHKITEASSSGSILIHSGASDPGFVIINYDPRLPRGAQSLSIGLRLRWGSWGPGWGSRVPGGGPGVLGPNPTSGSLLSMKPAAPLLGLALTNCRSLSNNKIITKN